ncbi:MAG: DUF2752 domain-containing protein [Clostridiales bacterium]|uniref:DUF2752 domain-containing protein n=1 Tax=Clostridium sp. N3C TaxID=1776758 RepID=UPI00092E1C12|nr:DUF2752 domain-containing protein [Clostridium sp. N3C]NLZ47488.1 DUF2752 domain-containing protein [Clostridiales bacterium]SCN26315.1 hypothetical protein N3C_2776 [Clostridium sp. N3C]
MIEKRNIAVEVILSIVTCGKYFGILAAIGAVSILFGHITNRSICLFYNITGVPCPGCGMTRAFLHLFKGNILQAFKYNPLFPLVIFIPFMTNLKKVRYIYFAAALVIIVWIIRLKLYFPNTEPMLYMEDNFISYLKVIIIKLFK